MITVLYHDAITVAHHTLSQFLEKIPPF